MSRSMVFFESFVDGFTMAGFLTHLRQPGAAMQLLACESDASQQGAVSTMLEDARPLMGSLRHIPESTLQNMISLLKQEEASRRVSRDKAEKASHVASR